MQKQRNFFSRLVPNFLKRYHPSEEPSQSFLKYLLGGSGALTSAGTSVTARSAMGVAAVYGAVTIRAEATASLPLVLMERLKNGDKEYKVRDPRYSLMHDNWNDEETSYEAREMMSKCVDLHGNGVAQVVYGPSGYPTAVCPVMPGDWRVERNADAEIVFWLKDHKGGEFKVERDGILHIRNHRLSSYLGESMLTLHRDTIGRAQAANDYLGALYKNGLNTKGVLETDLTIGEEEIGNLRAQFQTHYGGENAGRPLILEGGMKYKAISMSPADVEHVMTTKMSVLDVCRIFKVKPHQLCEMGGMNYGSMEEANKDFVTSTLRPKCVREESAYNRSLLLPDERGRLYFKYNLNALLAGNSEARSRIYAYGRQWGYMNVDEIRELEDMNKLPDGKGQIYLEPVNMQEAGKEPDVGDPTNPAGPKPGVDNNVKTPKKDPKAEKKTRDDQAHKELLIEQLRRVVNRDCQALKKKFRALGHGDEFRSFVASHFQVGHDAVFADTMTPAIKAYRAHAGLPQLGAKAIKNLHCDYVMRSVAELQDTDLKDDASVSAVENMLDAWFESRAENEAVHLLDTLRISKRLGDDEDGLAEAV